MSFHSQKPSSFRPFSLARTTAAIPNCRCLIGCHALALHDSHPRFLDSSATKLSIRHSTIPDSIYSAVHAGAVSSVVEKLEESDQRVQTQFERDPPYCDSSPLGRLRQPRSGEDRRKNRIETPSLLDLPRTRSLLCPVPASGRRLPAGAAVPRQRIGELFIEYCHPSTAVVEAFGARPPCCHPFWRAHRSPVRTLRRLQFCPAATTYGNSGVET